MEFTAHTLFGYFYVIFFLVIPTQSSELFTVHSPVGPLVALVGEEANLHCYISPAQNAEHMEVYWYHKPFTKPLQLYRGGNAHYREISLDNTERIQILKGDIGKGNITLRIQNVSVSDGGIYRCLFKDGDFTNEAVLELKVLAPDLDLEIQVQINILQMIEIRCSSGGWFPQAQIEWVDSRGELIPASSKSESLDEAGLFQTHITLALEQSQGIITCWLQHPVTNQEKKTSIQIADILFQQHDFHKKVVDGNILMFVSSLALGSLAFLVYMYHKRKAGPVQAWIMLLQERSLFQRAIPSAQAVLLSDTLLIQTQNGKIELQKILRVHLYILMKIITLLLTPLIVCYVILYTYVKFGIQDFQFSMKKFWMTLILQEVLLTMTGITFLILLYFVIRSL